LLGKTNFLASWHGSYSLKADTRSNGISVALVNSQRSLLLAEIPCHFAGTFVGTKKAKTQGIDITNENVSVGGHSSANALRNPFSSAKGKPSQTALCG
jgi:hypothetical protein